MKISFATTTMIAAARLAVAVANWAPDACMIRTTDLTLTEDFTCNCTDRPAIFDLMDGVTLDVNGYRVECEAGTSIDEGETGLIRLLGDGAAVKNGILDCRDFDVDGIRITGDEGQVIGMEIKKCEDSIRIVADRAYIFKNRIRDSGDDCIDLDGNYARIERNFLLDSNNIGIKLDGNYSEVIQNHIAGTGDDGIELSSLSSQNKIIRNTLLEIDDEGIVIEGDDNIVKENKVAMADGHCLDLSSGANNNQISYNDFSACNQCVELGGDYNEFSYNKVSLIEDSGVVVDGDHNMINGNDVSYTDGEGIDVGGDYNTVKRNKIYFTTTSDEGMEVDGDHNIIKENYIDTVGDHCIDLNGDDNKLIGNKLKDCQITGIDVSSTADDNLIKGNWIVGACDFSIEDTDSTTPCGSNTYLNNKGDGIFEPSCTANGSFKHRDDPWEAPEMPWDL